MQRLVVRRSRALPIVLTIMLAAFSLAGNALPAARSTARAVSTAGMRATTTLPGVTIYRDNFGVPHIMAANERALFFGAGYATAQDRLFQLELYRFQAEGRTSELFGPSALAADEFTRQTGYSMTELQSMFRALAPEYRMMFQAYAAGINAWLARANKNPQLMPYEFTLLHDTMQPWTPADSMAIMVMMVRDFGLMGGNELNNLALYQYLVSTYPVEQAQQIFNDMIYTNDPSSPTTIPAADDHFGKPQPMTPFGQLAALPKHLNPAVLKQPMAKWRGEINYAAAHGEVTHLGSNGWVVAPSRSATGHAELLGGPMMGFSVPQIANEQQLTGPGGFNVEGMAFAGVPGILIGHNATIAWTTTSGMSDEVDWYVETLNPANPTQYLYKGKWRTMSQRVETFQVAGGSPVTQTYYRTVHGPVVSFDLPNNVAYSGKTSMWKREWRTMIAFIKFDRANTLAQFQSAVSEVVSSHNFLYADQQGNIAYWAAGLQPIEPKGVDPRLPMPGTGQYEWRGYVPFKDRPYVINPAQGWLANWNNKPSKNWGSGDTPQWGQANHVQHIFNLLAANPRMDPNGMNAVAQNTGNFDFAAPYFLPYLQQAVAQAGSIDPRASTALAWLNQWDQTYSDPDTDGEYDAPGYTIFNQWLNDMTTNVFTNTLGANFLGVPAGDSMDNYTLRVIQGSAAPLPMQYQNYVQPGTVMTDIVTSLVQAINELTARYQSVDMSTWLSPDQYIHFNPEGAGVVPDIPYAKRGAYMQIVDLSSPTIWGENILPPGQSGFISPSGQMDPNMTNQLALYATWQYKPMLVFQNP